MAVHTDIAIWVQPLFPRNARDPFVEFARTRAREAADFHQNRGGQTTPDHNGRRFWQRAVQVNPGSRRKALGKTKFIEFVLKPIDQPSAARHA